MSMNPIQEAQRKSFAHAVFLIVFHEETQVKPMQIGKLIVLVVTC